MSDTLQLELLNTGHVASEALFNSIESVVERTMSGVTITAQGLYYAKWVNSGRPSIKKKPDIKGVPISVLIDWIRRCKIDLRGKREESVAYAMQISIRQKGIRPAPFIDKSIRKFERSKFIENHIEQFMGQYLDELLQTIFNELDS